MCLTHNKLQTVNVSRLSLGKHDAFRRIPYCDANATGLISSDIRSIDLAALSVRYSMESICHASQSTRVAYFTPQNASSSSPHSVPLSSPSATPNSRTLQESFYQSAPSPRSFATSPDLKNLDHVGPFAIEHSQSSPIPLEQGTTITAAYPVKGVQGMDLVVNAFGGHRQTNTGSNVGSAAVTAGVRFKW